MNGQSAELLASRRAKFHAFLDERFDVLKNFVERLGLSDPAMVAIDARQFLEPIDRWMRAQAVRPEDRAWIHTRLGYLIGEYLIQVLGGSWRVEDREGARFFARYVVGGFARGRAPNMVVDPFHAADVYLQQCKGRSLIDVLAEVESEIVGPAN